MPAMRRRSLTFGFRNKEAGVIGVWGPVQRQTYRGHASLGQLVSKCFVAMLTQQLAPQTLTPGFAAAPRSQHKPASKFTNAVQGMASDTWR